ncbi:hypothetical protein MKX01_023809 [Papaver californicum]|nr:hypothetical protein MKX01_023809 [Papaver californicum]
MAFIANRKTSSFLVLICFLTFSLHTTTTQACHRTERSALLDFKSKITLDQYNQLQTWNQCTDCCTKWEGISCDSNGRVVNVSRNGISSDEDNPNDIFMVGTVSPSLGSSKILEGTIPSELGKLSHLTTLLLDINQLNGSIPTSFQNLRKLNRLHNGKNLLSGTVPTNLSGGIPSSIDKLVSLKRLDLAFNNFSGSIPCTIGFLKNLLVVLDSCLLSDNKLTGYIPASIGNTRLRFLLLKNNRLSGKLPTSLGNLTKLNRLICKKQPNLMNLLSLDLSRNGLSGPIPSELVKLNAKLETLDLSFNPLSLVTVPSWISKMKLQGLYLAGTGLVELPEWLSSTSLFFLDVSSNRLARKLPTWIEKMKNLHTLNIFNNGFHSDIPIEFKNLGGLGVLDLHRNNFTGGLGSIFGVSGRFGYTFIDLSYNMFVGSIDKDIGNLETLKLDKNEFTGTIPADLSSISGLTSIVLSHNKRTGSIPSGVMNLLDFVEFDVSYNKLTGKIPPHKKAFPASSFEGNSALCDSPLPPCKTA